MRRVGADIDRPARDTERIRDEFAEPGASVAHAAPRAVVDHVDWLGHADEGLVLRPLARYCLALPAAT